MTSARAEDEVVELCSELIRFDTSNTGELDTTKGEREAADYVAAARKIRECELRYDQSMTTVDAIITPTVPILPPRIEDLQTTDAYLAMNTEVLRLTEIETPGL